MTEIITTYGRRHVRQFHKRCSVLHFQAWIPMVSKDLFQTTLFQKVPPDGSKTGSKSGPRTCLHSFLIRVFEDFFSVFSQPFKIHNSNYQCPATLRHPPYATRRNQLFSGRTDERTNGRTSPNLTLSDVKSASRKKRFEHVLISTATQNQFYEFGLLSFPHKNNDQSYS